MAPSKRLCKHRTLCTDPSPNAAEVGYKPFTVEQLYTAATGRHAKASAEFQTYSSMFPAPLVLPGHDLSYNPKHRGQSFASWFAGSYRNHITPNRKTIYVTRYPEVNKGAPSEILDWAQPRRSSIAPKRQLVPPPRLADVTAYLGAFFNGLPVKECQDKLQWVAWDDKKRSKPPVNKDPTQQEPLFIGLLSTATGTTTRIRARRLDDDAASAYPAQLNLKDVLDHAITTLPADAYCIVVLVEHDLYEDDEDDFCCGRAYGGSRVCVVSSAQYQPTLDAWQGIDVVRGHCWPASHCSDFVARECGITAKGVAAKRQCASARSNSSRVQKRPRGDGQSALDPIVIDDSIAEEEGEGAGTADLPLREAIAANVRCMSKNMVSTNLTSMYLSRLALTVSHELLHCFGFGHCVYYACAMQGTASIIEDRHQPPYLCPVCENRLAIACSFDVSGKTQVAPFKGDWWEMSSIADWKISRQEAILQFCVEQGADNAVFSPLAHWYQGVVSSLR